MSNLLFYSHGSSPSCLCAVRKLRAAGVCFTDCLVPDVTHLLLDIPSFQIQLPPSLPDHVTVIGGKLPAAVPCKKMDLLEDAFYLADNAAITAECALRVAFQELPCTLRDTEVLVIGWGRIGKHLAKLLSDLGAKVSVLSRSISHQAEISSFGLSALSYDIFSDRLCKFRVIFNTAPSLILPKGTAAGALKIDLASKPGMDGDDVIHANSLPGRLAPESSGALIARTILRKLKEETT